MPLLYQKEPKVIEQHFSATPLDFCALPEHLSNNDLPLIYKAMNSIHA